MDYGAEVVDEGFAGAGGQEEAGGEEPHCGIGEEDTGFGVQEHGLFESGVRVATFGGQRGGFCVIEVTW